MAAESRIRRDAQYNSASVKSGTPLITFSGPSKALSLVLALLLATACSPSSHSQPADAGEDGLTQGNVDAGPIVGDGCIAYQSDASLESPTVSFANDVLPIFESECGIGTFCHGGNTSMAVALRGVFLGCVPNGGTCDAGDPGPLVYAGLIGPNASKPEEESCMPFVAPSDPSQSYLMHKMDNDLCTVDCCIATNPAAGAVSATGCGGVMPYLGMMLPVSQRDAIRRWIKQGAPNN
jgi:hypothetical protein